MSSILIADNDFNARGLLSGWLEDAGYQCAAAQTADALSRARQQLPAAALVTVTSADDPGMWVLRTLSGDREPIAIVALTPTADLDLVAAARRVGAFDCLPWPSSRAEVLDSVRRALGWRLSTADARRGHAHVLEQLTGGRERLLNAVRGLKGDAAQVVLLAALEAHSCDLYHHAHRVASGAVALATALGLSPASLAAIRAAGLLHDIGRVAMPLMLTKSTTPATVDDVATWRMQVAVAEDVLNAIPGVAAAAPIVAAMHERFDGMGYPLGRTEDSIPIAARVLSVVDAYDTLVSQRGFDGPLTHDEAIVELVRRAGTQFDPDVVRGWTGVGDSERCF